MIDSIELIVLRRHDDKDDDDDDDGVSRNSDENRDDCVYDYCTSNDWEVDQRKNS